MNATLKTMSCLALAACCLTAAAAEKSANDLFNDLRKDAGGRQGVFAGASRWHPLPAKLHFDAFAGLLGNPLVGTNAETRINVCDYVARECRGAGDEWVAFVRAFLDDASVDGSRKTKAMESFCIHLCNEERFAEADRLLLGAIAEWKFRYEPDRVSLWLILADVRDWRQDPDAAVAALREGAKLQPDRVHRRAKELAAAWDRPRLMDEFDRLASPRQRLENGDARAVADYVCEPTNGLRSRVEVYVSRLAQLPRGSADERRAYRSLMSEPADGFNNVWWGPNETIVYNQVFVDGDWSRTVDFWTLFQRVPPKNRAYTGKYGAKLHFVTSLVQLGRKEQAAKACDAFAAEAKEASDRVRFGAFAKMLRGESFRTDALFAGGDFDARSRSEIVASLARQALAMDMNGLAERFAAEYKAFFTSNSRRTLRVPFSRKRIGSIADWRALLPTLEKGVCDQPFGVDAETLVTDVNTRRKVGTASEHDNANARMEFTCVADPLGLHFFLRVEDAAARKIEAGFADGISTEMYFAPGEDVNYQCFGSDAVKGVCWGMNFGYETAGWRRLDFSGRTGSGFHTETAFSDTDYVCHFSMDWENFYMRLPTDGTGWKFEVIAWTPKGGRTWGGSRSVHCVSEWGTLRFVLGPDDVTAIRRGLLLRTRSSWKTPKLTGDGYAIDFFDRWQDDVLGDVDFYAECLKSLREKLETSVKKITPEMDDATVNAAFEESLVTRLGLRHEIDRLRKRYLARKLTHLPAP